jgi:cysteinyl-tRNA synthetase
MPTLRIYNTLTKREEDFRPLDREGKLVRFYACGPTVYDYAHIGNFRSFLNADVLRRTLELIGYDVQQVMNMTDVGHMTDDEVADGGGEDKMEVAARRLAEAKKSGRLPPGTEIDPSDPYAVADFYVDAFLRDGRALGLKIVADADEHPELMPRPTRYVEPMIHLVERLIESDHAYVGADGVVYFDVQSFPAYGQLSGNTPDEIRSGEGGRVHAATQQLKRHPADFMLWKPDEKHIMRWPSPWGEGYPGWHLECSVMAMQLLGADTGGVIDIHSGGEDNIFPHHECEIAQACGATGEAHFARYWFHTRFLIVESEKMSKSKGNFYTVGQLVEEKNASPAAIRLELIKTHYRRQANFTIQGLKDSQRQIERWARLAAWLEQHAPFTAALCADVNVSGAIGALNEAASQHDTSQPPPASDDDGTYADELAALRAMDGVLGVLDLEREPPKREGSVIKVVITDALGASDTIEMTAGEIETKIAERNAARDAKDWATADRIRDELLELGIAIKDSAEGTTWTKVVG